VKVTELEVPGVLLVEPTVYGDSRGFFMEAWNGARYAEAGMPERFVQSNVSRSERGVLRGLHFQQPNPQGKLVWVQEGEVFDVAVDIRAGSPTFGQWVGAHLSAENHHQLYLPEGFAHGFCVLSSSAQFCYLCTSPYDAAADSSVRWNDPAINVEWPITAPRLSAKAANAPWLADLADHQLPPWQP
jgi:dTDP-4-dehydrorhamnose 3,5-epimerase